MPEGKKDGIGLNDLPKIRDVSGIPAQASPVPASLQGYRKLNT
jgi:hypothetical protein